MAGPFLTRDIENFVQIEAVVGTSPGALSGTTDAFKSKTNYAFKRVVQRYDRDQDRDNAQASVLSTQVGRENGQWAVEGDVIPSGVSATPTAPDMSEFFEAHFGVKTTLTAHTVLAAGSTATVINLTPGGGAATGIRVGGGDIILIDVGGAFGVEARRVVSRAVDAVTVTPALSAAPAAAQTVKVGTTYNPSSTLMKTLHLWGFINGDNFRHKVPAAIPSSIEINYDATGGTPVAGVKFSGDSYPIATHATARPAPTTIGQPLLPSIGKVFIGASGKLCICKFGFKGDNGVELRMNESCALSPSGVKRTKNNSRFSYELSMDLLLVTGGVVEGYYDNAAALTAYDVTIQLGTLPGQAIVICAPKFIPDADIGDQDGEVSLSLSGKLYGTVADDEVMVAIF